MANKPVKAPHWAPRQKLLAADLNAIVDMVTKRILGSRGVTARSAAGVVSLEGRDPPGKYSTIITVAELLAQNGDGSYNWLKAPRPLGYTGVWSIPGPASGVAWEYNGSSVTTPGFSGLITPLLLISGAWFFFFPVVACP